MQFGLILCSLLELESFSSFLSALQVVTEFKLFSL